MSCSGGESIQFTLWVPLINDLSSALYSGWLSRCTLFPNFTRPTLLRPLARPPFVLQRHSTTTRMHLNINADTNNKSTNKDYNIETKYTSAWSINSCGIFHGLLFLFIHSLYNQADVWRAGHSPVYEERERRKEEIKLDELMAHCCPLLWQ